MQKNKTSQNGFILSYERSCFVEQKIELNDNLINWISSIVKDMIESTLEDDCRKIPTIVAVNDFLNKLEFNFNSLEMSDLFGEEITNRIFDEIKSNI